MKILSFIRESIKVYRIRAGKNRGSLGAYYRAYFED